MAPAAFPRAARLLTSKDFSRLRGISRRLGTPNFSAEIAVAEQPGARLGLAVSRKVSKKAVRRNRIKRIARDSFRRHRAELPSVDILLIARFCADAADNAILHAELDQLWQRIAALNGVVGTGTMRA
jgi:ribonuclease P protein component